MRLTVAAQAMGHHPAAVRLFAEWSYRRLLKSGVKFAFVVDPENKLPSYRGAAADAKSLADAQTVLKDWRDFGRSMTMQNCGDGALAAYDGMRAAARINLHEMQREQRGALVERAKSLLAMMTLCPPVNTPLEFFLGSSRDQHTASMTPDCDAVASHPPSASKVAIGEAVSVLEQHALMDLDGDQVGMHQLMALAVRAELEAEAPGSCAGVHDLQALLTARYGTEEDVDVDAEEYEGMREVGDAAEYAVTAAIEAVGGADVQLQRWACGMYLRLAKVQVVVTSDTRNCERLLAAAKACLQRLQGQSCAGLRELDWRMQIYRAYVPRMKGNYDEALSMLQSVESEFADCTIAGLHGKCNLSFVCSFIASHT